MATRWRKAYLAALTFAVGAILAAAQEPSIQRSAPQLENGRWTEVIQCRIPVKPGGRLVLDAKPGMVDVKPGPDNAVHCLVHLVAYTRNPQEARTCLDRYQIKAIRTVDGALIEGQPACEGSSGVVSATFDADVPLKFNLDIKSQGGDVLVEKLAGTLRATTAGGDIRTGDVLGPVRVSTAGGTIDLGNIGESVEAHSAGGNIRVGNVNGSATLQTRGGVIVAGIVNGPLTAQTAAGDIVLQAASGPVVVDTAGGQIHLGECGNSVRAQSAGGNIQVAGARGFMHIETSGGNITLLKAMGPVTAETAAGRILAQFAANRRTFGPSRLETQAGDVDVFIPSTLPVTVNALINRTMGRRIISDFPLTATANSNFAFGPERAQVVLQGGGSPLDIRTMMGSIQIRKLDPASAVNLKSFQKSFWRSWNEMSRQRDETLREMRGLDRAIEIQNAEFQKQLQELDRQLMERSSEQIKH